MRNPPRTIALARIQGGELVEVERIFGHGLLGRMAEVRHADGTTEVLWAGLRNNPTFQELNA